MSLSHCIVAVLACWRSVDLCCSCGTPCSSSSVIWGNKRCWLWKPTAFGQTQAINFHHWQSVCVCATLIHTAFYGFAQKDRMSGTKPPSTLPPSLFLPLPFFTFTPFSLFYSLAINVTPPPPLFFLTVLSHLMSGTFTLDSFCRSVAKRVPRTFI